MSTSNSFQAMVGKASETSKKVVSAKKALNMVDLKNQCRCPHRLPTGSFALITKRGGKDNQILTCNICAKSVNINSLPQIKVDEAIDTIDRIIDLAKMSANTESIKDIKLLGNISQLQFAITSIIPDLYKGVKAKNNNSGNRGGKNIDVDRTPMGQ